MRAGYYPVIALLLAGCASGTSSGGTSIQAPFEQVKLDVSIGSTDGPTIATASYWVGSDGTPRGTGFLDDADAAAVAAALREPAVRNRLLAGESPDQACTETYGGPDVATVTGSIGGHGVATSFHRANGCGLADWALLAPLIGRARWDVDHRVYQRDESSIDVSTGDLFSIELASNATTGYAWESTIGDAALLREVDHHYLAPPATAQVGQGGYERFMYEATASGDTTINFEYRRPTEPGTTPAADSARFAVHISPRVTPADSSGTSTTIPTPATTTGTTRSGSPETSWAELPANAAGAALTRFVDAVRALHEGVQPLLAEAATVSGGSTVPASVSQHAAGAVAEFRALPGDDPRWRGSLRSHRRCRRAVRARPRARPVPVRAWLGIRRVGRVGERGRRRQGRRARDRRPPRRCCIARIRRPIREDPTGADAAAFHGGLDVLLTRAFGHANFNTQPPWSVRWIGGLPADPTTTSCPADGVPSSTDTFVEQLGGCAVIYYDTSDPAAHDSELDSWLADRGSVPTFAGEVITIRWTNGEWAGIGSAE